MFSFIYYQCYRKTRRGTKRPTRKHFDKDDCGFSNCKCVIAEKLVLPYLSEKGNQSVRRVRVRLGSILSNHMLLENDGKRSANCEDTTKRTSLYGCAQCMQAFHVNCFTLYHFRDALNSHRPVLVRLKKDEKIR